MRVESNIYSDKNSFKKTIAFVTCLLFVQLIFAQQNDSINVSAVTIWGFGDFYYAYDFNKPATHDRPGFIYSHNRHNEFAINNAIMGLKYNKDRIRGALALHTGTYVRANYATEPDLLKLIYEAYAGYKLGKNVWLDAGIFSSHIGAESAISLDNLTLSRSMMADNTPYYETGVKLSWNASENLILTGLVLNGWQNIAENNNNKALGTQILFRPFKNTLFNSSTFFGKEKPGYDSLISMRYFHDFYAQWDFKKITILAAFDIGWQKQRLSSGSCIWYNPNLIVRYKVSDKFAIAGRAEYYHDPHGVIIHSGTPQGFQTFSSSLNFDYWFTKYFAWRTELRMFHSKDKVFTEGNILKNSNAFVLTSIAIRIQ